MTAGRHDPTPDEVRRLRDLTGFGLAICRRAFLSASEFEGDVVVALAAIDLNGVSVAVKGDRAAWVRNRAFGHADRWRARNPGLDEAFPKPADPSAPAPAP